MKSRNPILLTIILAILFLFIWNIRGSFANPFLQDTTKTDTTQQVKPNYYKGVDVKIVYTFENEKPTWYRNVCCQLIKEKGEVKEIKVFLKTCTEEIRVIKGFVKFEVRDHNTHKIIAQGP